MAFKVPRLKVEVVRVKGSRFTLKDFGFEGFEIALPVRPMRIRGQRGT